MRIVPLSILALAGLALAAPASAQRHWTLLGEREIADRAGRDVIAVGGARIFREIRICTARRGVALQSVDIRFQGGGNHEVRLRTIIAADGCTGALRLRDPRAIDRIVFRHAARRGARVRLYGR